MQEDNQMGGVEGGGVLFPNNSVHLFMVHQKKPLGTYVQASTHCKPVN